MKEIKFYEDAKVVDLVEEMRNKAEKNLPNKNPKFVKIELTFVDEKSDLEESISYMSNDYGETE